MRDDVACHDAGPGSGRVRDRRHHLDAAILDREIDAKAAEPADAARVSVRRLLVARARRGESVGSRVGRERG
jgi:hypothetical protein